MMAGSFGFLGRVSGRHWLHRAGVRTISAVPTRRSRSIAFATVLLTAGAMLSPALAQPQPAAPDPWEPVRAFVGEWVGSAEGKSGAGTVRRVYAFILEDRFLHESNISTYPPQPANPSGETHRHWSLFSYDRERKVLVLRQFHQEGFVNQYVLNAAESKAGKLVFDSERFENFDNEWKARETYEIRSVDEFVETFELGEPGKTLEVYSENHFKRYKGERCADNKSLSELKQQYGLLVLCAANDVVAGADSVCTATFPEFWQTYNPETLRDRTPPEKVNAALDWVCASVLSLPTGPDTEVIRKLGAWCALNKWIDSLGEPEALATAVALVPATADLLADQIAARGIAKEDIGESLASTEHTRLRYALTRRLVSMPEDELAATLLALSDEVTKIKRARR